MNSEFTFRKAIVTNTHGIATRLIRSTPKTGSDNVVREVPLNSFIIISVSEESFVSDNHIWRGVLEDRNNTVQYLVESREDSPNKKFVTIVF